MVQLSLLLTKRSSTSLIILCLCFYNAKLQIKFDINVKTVQLFQKKHLPIKDKEFTPNSIVALAPSRSDNQHTLAGDEESRNNDLKKNNKLNKAE